MRVGPALTSKPIRTMEDFSEYVGLSRPTVSKYFNDPSSVRIKTRNLIDALEGLGQTKIVAQSVAWTMRPGLEADAVASLEQAVLAASGVVLRYGMFYGPGTYFEDELPPAPRVHIDTAAARTLQALDTPPGIVTVVE